MDIPNYKRVLSVVWSENLHKVRDISAGLWKIIKIEEVEKEQMLKPFTVHKIYSGEMNY